MRLLPTVQVCKAPGRYELDYVYKEPYLGLMPIDVIATVKEVANAVKKYNDVPLMNQVFDLQQALLELQTDYIETKKQLDDARTTLEIRQSIHKRGEYFYKDGDEEPLCAKCWQKDDKPVYMSALRDSSTWGKFRECVVCKHMVIEEQPRRGPRQINPHSGWG
jgi:hypothetical protein